MSDLVDRFRAFQARARAGEAPAAAQDGTRAAGPGPALPAGRWTWLATPFGPLPACLDRRPVARAAALRGSWPARVAREDLGRPEDWLWLDLETTGLGGGSGTRAFLVGIGRLVGAELEVRQLLLPDLDREPALLWAVAREWARASAVVTFNGKAFDWPLLRDRATLCGLTLPPRPHWDVLHAARLLWPEGPHTLRAMQERVLGQPRRADVPGEWVPALYRAWLEGDGGALEAVVAHNREDLGALAGLAAGVAATLEEGPRAGVPAEALWGLGRLYEKVGEAEAAVACYLACRAAGVRRGAVAAGRLLKRLGRHEEAVPVWEAARRGAVPSAEAAVELAKYWEHRRRDPEAALAVVRDILRLAPLLGPTRRAELERRLRRLERKAAARRGGVSPAAGDPEGKGGALGEAAPAVPAPLAGTAGGGVG